AAPRFAGDLCFGKDQDGRFVFQDEAEVDAIGNRVRSPQMDDNCLGQSRAGYSRSAFEAP
ncbi:hypothetical protein ACC743_40145, partial [Rhizobium ruizarguesonis]